MERPVPGRNGTAATQLQPVATCRNLGSTLLDFSIFQKELEISIITLYKTTLCGSNISLG